MASSDSPSTVPEADLVLVGGGLQNALAALAVLGARPEARVVLVEAGRRVGGNHTWCFHAGDVPERARALVEPLVVASWPGYEVAFPRQARSLAEPYGAISSERLAQVVEARFRDAPNAVLLTETRAAEIRAHEVTLADGRRLRGRAVIDARGPSRFGGGAHAGFQKFVGYEALLSAPSPVVTPLLMDATVPQTDGLRFFYVLPLGERRVLLEDTYFSDEPELDRAALGDGIRRYAAQNGFHVERVVRTESGVLPLPVRASSPEPHDPDAPFVAGYAGGFFHPATGYSFPVALRLALHLAEHFDDPLGDALGELRREHSRQFRFAALLNRLLFSAFRPEDRWNAFARFYRLPAETIRRFYALDTTSSDRARILCGRPPSGISVRAFLGGALS